MEEKIEFDRKARRFDQLCAYLASDVGNLNLLADAAASAYSVNLPEMCLELLSRYEAIAALPGTLLNLKGLALLQAEHFEDAAEVFYNLHSQSPSEPALRFNLAWAKAMTGNDVPAVELLDEATIAAIPQSRKLKVQALHRLGDLETALQSGMILAEHYADDSALMGALSLVAIDLQMPELAQAWAEKAEGTDEGLSSLGVLVLQQNRIEDALSYFERGLALRPDSARNFLGKGLALLANGDAADAVGYLDRSAEIFGTHLGTWIGAGWAHFAVGDRARAREIFEHTLTLDDTFAESHGALAVLDHFDGNPESARTRTEVALRLDKSCFAGALAKILLLESGGQAETAQRLRDITLNRPLESGRTLAEAIAAFAPNWQRRVESEY